MHTNKILIHIVEKMDTLWQDVGALNGAQLRFILMGIANGVYQDVREGVAAIRGAHSPAAAPAAAAPTDAAAADAPAADTKATVAPGSPVLPDFAYNTPPDIDRSLWGQSKQCYRCSCYYLPSDERNQGDKSCTFHLSK